MIPLLNHTGWLSHLEPLGVVQPPPPPVVAGGLATLMMTFLFSFAGFFPSFSFHFLTLRVF
jgi:hypothetical protein